LTDVLAWVGPPAAAEAALGVLTALAGAAARLLVLGELAGDGELAAHPARTRPDATAAAAARTPGERVIMSGSPLQRSRTRAAGEVTRRAVSPLTTTKPVIRLEPAGSPGQM
jgi:hypothetical protein